jgi:hypothetical protein
MLRDDDPERLRRGLAARSSATERWAWPALAGHMADALDEAYLTGTITSPV